MSTSDKIHVHAKIPRDLVERFDEMYPIHGIRTYVIQRTFELMIAEGDVMNDMLERSATAIIDELK